MAQVLPPKKPQFFEEKMLRLLEIFFLKNSSQFFLKPWRVRASNINILLIGAIKHYNYFYCHFLLRLFLSEIFTGPFHQAKAESSSRTVLQQIAIQIFTHTKVFDRIFGMEWLIFWLVVLLRLRKIAQCTYTLFNTLLKQHTCFHTFQSMPV